MRAGRGLRAGTTHAWDAPSPKLYLSRLISSPSASGLYLSFGRRSANRFLLVIEHYHCGAVCNSVFHYFFFLLFKKLPAWVAPSKCSCCESSSAMATSRGRPKKARARGPQGWRGGDVEVQLLRARPLQGPPRKGAQARRGPSVSMSKYSLAAASRPLQEPPREEAQAKKGSTGLAGWRCRSTAAASRSLQGPPREEARARRRTPGLAGWRCRNTTLRAELLKGHRASNG
jgi:hypothetical protein